METSVRLTPSDPDIQTLIARISSRDMDLQPNFQRGEVWSLQKKKRLIDSILRDWHVPPIHVVVTDDDRQEVLDGQQRLAAIRDFADDEFTVDGCTEPYDEDISHLHQLSYSELPQKFKRRFDGFTIRVFRITDYQPSEPGELFFRLNQPTNLTAAEQRNAFFGPVREQIKRVVEYLELNGIDDSFFGFSNARMAYDDVLAKVAISIENGSLREKVSAAAITDRYRSDVPLNDFTLHSIYSCVDVLSEVKKYIGPRSKYNKATLFSWLFFFVTLAKWSYRPLGEHYKKVASFMASFELLRNDAKRGLVGQFLLINDFSLDRGRILDLFMIYNDRSSSRVGDVSSILIRDLVTWIFFVNYSDFSWPIAEDKKNYLDRISDEMSSTLTTDQIIINAIEYSGWGYL
jgi:hypothetical protein